MDSINNNGFFDAFQRITDSAVSVISAVKGNKAAEQAAQQQVAVQQQNSTNTVKIVVIVVGGVLTLGLLYLIFRPKKG